MHHQQQPQKQHQSSNQLNQNGFYRQVMYNSSQNRRRQAKSDHDDHKLKHKNCMSITDENSNDDLSLDGNNERKN